MALSNIFNEPRREITETLVGVAVLIVPVVAFVYLDYQFAVWFALATQDESGRGGAPIPVGMLLGILSGAIAIIIGIGVAVLVHAVGESICDAMQRRGIHLRPVRR